MNAEITAKARQAKREKRQQALEPMLKTLLLAQRKTEWLMCVEDESIILRAVNSACQVALAYAKVLEAGELASRLEILEDHLTAMQNEVDA
jgi:hypothetical protein